MALPAFDDLADGLDSNWTITVGGFTTSGSRLRGNNSGLSSAFWNADTFAEGHSAKATFYTNDSDGSRAGGMVVRLKSTDGGNDYFVYQLSGTGFKTLYRVDNGTRTSIATGSGTTTSGQTFQLDIDADDNMQGWQNGSTTNQPATQDTTYAGGSAGLYLKQTSSAAAELTDWTGDDVGGGGGSTFQPAWAMNSNVVIQ